MGFNVNYQQDAAEIPLLITTSVEFENAIKGFIQVSADYSNNIKRMELTIIQRAMNLLITDEDNTPQICGVSIKSDGYHDIAEDTDENGWLSTDCGVSGTVTITCPGKITQTHDYNTDILAGGVLQYTMISSRNIKINLTRVDRTPIQGAIASFFDTSGNFVSSATSDANGYCTLNSEQDGYVLITKYGYQTQKHNCELNDTGIIMDLTMLSTIDVVGSRFGYSVSLSPSNPQGTDYF